MFTYKKGIQLSIIALTGSLLAACSTAPLICDSSLPTAQQINGAHTPIHLNKASDLAKLPSLSHQPLTMTFTANKVQSNAQGNNSYVVVIPVKHVNHVLAVQKNSPNNFAVYISHGALKPFWKQATPYINNAYHYGVITANNLSSKIVKINNQQFNGKDITYNVTSSAALPTGYLNHVTFTVDQ